MKGPAVQAGTDSRRSAARRGKSGARAGGAARRGRDSAADLPAAAALPGGAPDCGGTPCRGPLYIRCARHRSVRDPCPRHCRPVARNRGASRPDRARGGCRRQAWGMDPPWEAAGCPARAESPAQRGGAGPKRLPAGDSRAPSAAGTAGGGAGDSCRSAQAGADLRHYRSEFTPLRRKTAGLNQKMETILVLECFHEDKKVSK